MTCLTVGRSPGAATTRDEPSRGSSRLVGLLAFSACLAYLAGKRRKHSGERRGLGAHHAKESGMPKLKHIALSTQDVEKTAKFYIDVFGMKQIGKIDSPSARGYYLSDGDINLAILNFKSDAAAGAERGKEYSGIHHIGFQVESLEEITERLAVAGSQPRDDVNQALGVGQGQPRHANVEVKYGGPDGVMVDVSETGWVGTTGFSV
jgi:catechol 2,3-dioxygenase-like lactoylglutathione lyase family enzyme